MKTNANAAATKAAPCTNQTSKLKTADRFFTAANAERYRETATERGITELGVSEHIYRFAAALDIW